MIVEHEGGAARDLQQMLGELGYDAYATASSAEAAMARAAEQRPAIVLVDIKIKGKLDGIKTAELLQERFGVAVVYLTAHTDDATVQRALRTRPYGYLLKPVRLGELKSAIEIALYRHGADLHEPAVAPAPGDAPAARTAARDVPGAKAVRKQLAQILANPDFDAAKRSRDLLKFIVEETVAGRGDALTQTELATQVFGRKGDFDPIVDPIVRIQAGRLRRSLERYYLLSGKQDPVRIELPKGSYAAAFRHSVVAAPAAAPDAAAVASPSIEIGFGWPTVVVSRFAGTPSTAEADPAARLQEELALEMGYYPAVRVVLGTQSRDTAHMCFALGGRLNSAEGGWRVTARLVELATGEQVWGDEYRTSLQPGVRIGSLQDVARVIAARVAGEAGVLVQHLLPQHRRPAAGATAYEAIVRSNEFFLARDLGSLALAIAALRQLVESQPQCGVAWSRLARLYTTDYTYEISHTPAPIDEAIRCAQRGVRADPASRSARCVLAAGLLVKGELDLGLKEVDEALRTSPGSLFYLEIIGYLMTLLGDWKRGAAVSQEALARNPHCLPQVLFGVWADSLRRGDVDEAHRAALEFLDPTFYWRAVMRASCLGLLGRTDDARSEVRQILAARPDFALRGRRLIGHVIKSPEAIDRIIDGLAKGGLSLA